MKDYKMVHLNKGMTFSREKDLEKAEITLNQYIKEGWTLHQVFSSPFGMGATLVAVIYREN